MLKKLKLLATISTICFATGASAWVDEKVDNNTLPKIIVALYDSFNGGCWTNLGEAKTYAEDQLKYRGYTIVEDSSWDGHFYISGNSARSGDKCYGDISVELSTIAHADPFSGFLKIGQSSRIFKGYPDINTLILDEITRFIDDME